LSGTSVLPDHEIDGDREPAGEAPPLNVWTLSWQVSQHRPGEFWLGAFLWICFMTTPVLTGYFLSRGYDALATGDTRATYGWALAVLASEVVRMLFVHAAAIVWTRVWVHMQSLLRANMLAAQVASGGPEAGQPVGSAGGALTHFREDTEDVANLVDISIDVTGGLILTALAGLVLGATDLRAALVIVIPLVTVVVVVRAFDGRIKEYRAADRAAAAEVTAYVGDVMAAATTVKVNDATDSVVERLRTHVEHRRRTAVRDRMLDDGLRQFSEGAADVALGLVLFVSAGAIASGSFSVGELSLFVAYLGWLTWPPRMVGRLLARRKQTAVAFDRMRLLVADENPENTVVRRDVPIGSRDVRVRPPAGRPERIPLERLEVRSLSARYPGGGITGVDLTIDRGEFVVVTGPVGAGKTTLLRAILGLAWQAEVTGEVRWNDRVIEDRAAFFVPPNAAFLSQVPQLISDTVADNVALGPFDRDDLDRSLELAAVRQDVEAMPSGIETLIGPRGLRLSGGQRQRLAAARALVHAPELIVLDDVSSAVDVETEIELWTKLAEAGMTVLAVSHRAVAFDRADRILRL
jgi:ATP-binding cassette subfamily B protein